MLSLSKHLGLPFLHLRKALVYHQAVQLSPKTLVLATARFENFLQQTLKSGQGLLDAVQTVLNVVHGGGEG